MPDFWNSAFAQDSQIEPLDVLLRLVLALVLGGVVAAVYRSARKRSEISPSFTVTLVLLVILICIVTQVIGDNVARAFSLVGALSIVRFRTVVRDTQDTAYVIFAVVIGMAVGARHIWAAVIGIGVVSLAAYLLVTGARFSSVGAPAILLHLRVALGHDLEQLLGGTLDAFLRDRELCSVGTAKQGAALEVTYEARLKNGGALDELVKSLNRIDGVQSAEAQRRGMDLS